MLKGKQQFSLISHYNYCKLPSIKFNTFVNIITYICIGWKASATTYYLNFGLLNLGSMAVFETNCY